MSTQTEEHRAFLDLVYASLVASAKEAERIAEFTGTKLVRINSAEPMIPEEMKPFLRSRIRISTSGGGYDNKNP